jgi:phosphoglycolate phosphatase-like HAD superfamily hydrolase
LSLEFNFRQISYDEINHLKELSSRELIKYLKIPIYKIPTVLFKARNLMKKEIKSLPAFANFPEIIKQIHAMDINLGILTSNSSENVTEWLRHNKMESYFDFTHNESSYFGKNRILKKIIKIHKMDHVKTFYVGDETRDIESAKACHINAIAVTWGFNSENILRKYQPHFIVRKPTDIITICEKINDNDLPDK